MQKFLKISALFVIVVAISAAAIINSNWNIDPNYSIKFKGKNAEGTFSGLKGTVVYDPNNLPASKIDVTVETNSIKTGNGTKDEHALGESWFDAAKYPVIRFTTNNLSKMESGQLMATGTLDLHGVKKELKVPLSILDKDGRLHFQGKFAINRVDYGIKGAMMASFANVDEYEVEVNVPVSR